MKIANQVELLGLGVSLLEEVLVDDGYVGEGYTIPSEQGNEAIKLAARMEGMLLDPVYTGKSMAGLIDLNRRGDSALTTRSFAFLHRLEGQGDEPASLGPGHLPGFWTLGIGCYRELAKALLT